MIGIFWAWKVGMVGTGREDGLPLGFEEMYRTPNIPPPTMTKRATALTSTYFQFHERRRRGGMSEDATSWDGRGGGVTGEECAAFTTGLTSLMVAGKSTGVYEMGCITTGVSTGDGSTG